MLYSFYKLNGKEIWIKILVALNRQGANYKK